MKLFLKMIWTTASGGYSVWTTLLGISATSAIIISPGNICNLTNKKVIDKVASRLDE